MFEPLSTTAWRDLLGIEMFQNKPDSYVAKRRTDVQIKLMDCMKAGKLEGSIDLAKMGTAPVLWRNQPVPNPPLPQSVISEVFWELFEINFRYELVALDRLCYQFKPANFEQLDGQPFDELDASSTGDREIRILGCIPHFNGRLIPEGPEVGRAGFASSDVEERRGALWGLFRIMRGWTKMGKMSAGTIERAAAVESAKDISTVLLDEFEYRLACHYVWCFVVWFKRAPLLPHGL
ncbi:hypothetical protein BDZ89DRAFT_831426 [Hymenopellis radicata]|nr:hypothetical protein BDZ89DRAFT_831426 [Hymenopellis radicata]